MLASPPGSTSTAIGAPPTHTAVRLPGLGIVSVALDATSRTRRAAPAPAPAPAPAAKRAARSNSSSATTTGRLRLWNGSAPWVAPIVKKAFRNARKRRSRREKVIILDAVAVDPQPEPAQSEEAAAPELEEPPQPPPASPTIAQPAVDLMSHLAEAGQRAEEGLALREDAHLLLDAAKPAKKVVQLLERPAVVVAPKPLEDRSAYWATEPNLTAMLAKLPPKQQNAIYDMIHAEHHLELIFEGLYPVKDSRSAVYPMSVKTKSHGIRVRMYPPPLAPMQVRFQLCTASTDAPVTEEFMTTAGGKRLPHFLGASGNNTFAEVDVALTVHPGTGRSNLQRFHFGFTGGLCGNENEVFFLRGTLVDSPTTRPVDTQGFVVYARRPDKCKAPDPPVTNKGQLAYGDDPHAPTRPAAAASEAGPSRDWVADLGAVAGTDAGAAAAE